MLPKEVKDLLDDVLVSTEKITTEEIKIFDRRSTKEDIDELRRLAPILSKAVTEDNTKACNQITTTISKIVKKYEK